MSEHLAITVEPLDECAPAKVPCSRDSFKHVRELHDTIARRAFMAFEGRGCKDGYDFDDCMKAESNATDQTKHGMGKLKLPNMPVTTNRQRLRSGTIAGEISAKSQHVQ